MGMTRRFLVAAAFVGSAVAQRDLIYRNRAEWKVSWVSPSGGKPLTKEQVYVFENAASRHILELLEAEEDTGLLPEQHVLSSVVNVMSQQLEGDESMLSSSIDLTYIGHKELVSLASILQQAAAKNDEKRLDGIVKSVQLFDDEATSFGDAFLDPDDPSAEVVHILDTDSGGSKHSTADKGLIVACVFLSLALVAVSSILVWAAGGFEKLWIKIKQRPTASVTTPYGFKSKKSKDSAALSGIGLIGAKSYDSENIPPAEAVVSPNRGIYREQDSSILSPMSQNTNLSMQTDASRHPLGIRSIRKLSRYLTPEKLKKDDDEKPTYQMTRMT